MAMNHQTDISNGHMHTYMWKNLIDYFVNFVFQCIWKMFMWYLFVLKVTKKCHLNVCILLSILPD
jgi:predicted neutral ceramidase superfamily lipid hydrolase